MKGRGRTPYSSHFAADQGDEEEQDTTGAAPTSFDDVGDRFDDLPVFTEEQLEAARDQDERSTLPVHVLAGADLAAVRKLVVYDHAAIEAAEQFAIAKGLDSSVAAASLILSGASRLAALAKYSTTHRTRESRRKKKAEQS